MMRITLKLITVVVIAMAAFAQTAFAQYQSQGRRVDRQGHGRDGRGDRRSDDPAINAENTASARARSRPLERRRRQQYNVTRSMVALTSRRTLTAGGTAGDRRTFCSVS